MITPTRSLAAVPLYKRYFMMGVLAFWTDHDVSKASVAIMYLNDSK